MALADKLKKLQGMGEARKLTEGVPAEQVIAPDRLELLTRRGQSSESLPPGATVAFRAVNVNLPGGGQRIHSLLVDVYVDVDGKRERHTAGLKRRLCLGLRNLDQWGKNLDEAITIALNSPPVKGGYPSWNTKCERQVINQGNCKITLLGKWVVSASGPAHEVLQIFQQLTNEGADDAGERTEG